jgi:uncharacterized protein YlzI (FlbEa/FlbD family)
MPNFQATTVILSNSEYFELTSDAAYFRQAIEAGEQDNYLDIILKKEYLSIETKDAVLNRIRTLQNNIQSLKEILNPNDLPY